MFSHTFSLSVDGNDRAKLVPIADMVQMCAVYMLYVLLACCFVLTINLLEDPLRVVVGVLNDTLREPALSEIM